MTALDESVLADAQSVEQQVGHRYAVRLTPFLRSLLAGRGDEDPLVRQFRPDRRELLLADDDLDDPIGDADRSPVAGIVHRYPDRVLLKPVHVCAAYCRFCFRREQVGPSGEFLDEPQMAAALDYIRQTPTLWEVVLTGGDPLVLSGRRLGEILRALEAIPHLGAIRLHSRLPLHDPEAVAGERLAALAEMSRIVPWVAVHFNHPDELVPPVRAALDRLRQAGAVLVAQTVLLRGVNDRADVLCRLFRSLVECGVKPYYLHHPDRANGTSHFRLPIERGQEIFAEVFAQLSGIARPTYILDRPRGLGKVPLYPPSPLIAGSIGEAL